MERPAYVTGARRSLSRETTGSRDYLRFQFVFQEREPK